MEAHLRVLLDTPHLFERFLFASSNLAVFVAWISDNEHGCKLKARSDETQIKILSFMLSNHALLRNSGVENFLVSYVAQGECPPYNCLMLVKNILLKWLPVELVGVSSTQLYESTSRIQIIALGVEEIDIKLRDLDKAVPYYLSGWSSSGVLGADWLLEPKKILFPSTTSETKKRSRVDTVAASTIKGSSSGLSDQEDEADDGVPEQTNCDGSSTALQVVRVLNREDDNDDGMSENLPKKHRGDGVSELESDVRVTSPPDNFSMRLEESIFVLLTDVSTISIRVKSLASSSTASHEIAVIIGNLCSLLDTCMEICLSPSLPLLMALRGNIHAMLMTSLDPTSVSDSLISSSVRISGVVLLAHCVECMNLRSTRILSDESFLTLVEKYSDSNERSMRHLPVFLALVVLPRFRALTGPASRVFLKTMEVLSNRCPGELVRCVLAKGLCGRHTLGTPRGEPTDCPFQLECVHRMVRQGILDKDHAELLLGSVFLAGIESSSSELTLLSFNPSGDGTENLVDLLDCLMAKGDGSHNTLGDLLKATGSSEDTIGMAKDERELSGRSLCILRPRPVGVVHSEEKVYTFVYINSAAVMSSPLLLLSAASTKALCSTILTVIKHLKAPSLQRLVAYLDASTSSSPEVSSLPIVANVLHSIVTSHPEVLPLCREDLVRVLSRSPSIVAKNALNTIRKNRKL